MNIMSLNHLLHKTHSTEKTSQADRSRAFRHCKYVMHSVRASQMTSSVFLKMQFRLFNIFYRVTIYHTLFSFPVEFCWTGNSLKFFPFIFLKFFILKYRWQKTYHFNQFQLCSSVKLSTFHVLVHHYQHPSPELFHVHKWNSITIKQ